MSKSLINLLWDRKRKLLLDMMNSPIGSGERFVYRELIRDIEMALTSGEVGAA